MGREGKHDLKVTKKNANNSNKISLIAKFLFELKHKKDFLGEKI